MLLLRLCAECGSDSLRERSGGAVGSCTGNATKSVGSADSIGPVDSLESGPVESCSNGPVESVCNGPVEPLIVLVLSVGIGPDEISALLSIDFV